MLFLSINHWGITVMSAVRSTKKNTEIGLNPVEGMDISDFENQCFFTAFPFTFYN